MTTSSGFIQCFYSILLLLFRAFSLLDMIVLCSPVVSISQ